MKILHITPHMGGGVGQALSSLAVCERNQKYDIEHFFFLLEEPINKVFLNRCQQKGIKIYINGPGLDIEEILESADIIQLEWWNHPLMLKLLYDYRIAKMRLSIWSHISGCSYPYLHPSFIALPDLFFFSTPYSLENPSWSESDRKIIESKAKIAMSCPNYKNYIRLESGKHKSFNIGYVGALDFFKLHKDFISICSNINIPNVKFIIVGDGADRTVLEDQAEKLGVSDLFEFTGYACDVASHLARFDVFMYPLQPDHTGTMEQVVLEAMAASLPCVLLNQSSERYLIKHLQTGILAENTRNIPKWIDFLYENKEKRREIGKNASVYIAENLTTEYMLDEFFKQYSRMMLSDKRLYDVEKFLGKEPHEWFLKSCGHFADIFINESEPSSLPHNMRMERRGSLLQYADTFKDDDVLKRWVEIWLR